MDGRFADRSTQDGNQLADHGPQPRRLDVFAGYARVAPELLAADALLDHFADLPAALERLGLIP